MKNRGLAKTRPRFFLKAAALESKSRGRAAALVFHALVVFIPRGLKNEWMMVKNNNFFCIRTELTKIITNLSIIVNTSW